MSKKKSSGATNNPDLRLTLADSFWRRGWGLLGRKGLERDQGLWIQPCSSVHTLLMRFPVDLVYLDSEYRVTKIHPRMTPFKFSSGPPGTHSVLQLPEGFLIRHHLTEGDRLSIEMGENKQATVSLKEKGSEEGAQAGSRESVDEQHKGGKWAQLFPSPTFVAPIVLPAIMFGIGLGLGFRGAYLLVDVTAGNAIRGIGTLLGLRESEAAKAARAKAAPDLSRERFQRIKWDDNGTESEAAVLVTSSFGDTQSFQVSEKPATIGSGEACEIRLPDAPGLGEEHARLWWRDGKLMLHHLAPDLSTYVGSRPIQWTALEDGDEAGVGPYTIRIAMGHQLEIPEEPELGARFTPREFVQKQFAQVR